MRRYILSLTLFSICIALAMALFIVSRESKDSDFLVLYGNVDVRQVDLGFRVQGRVTEMPFQEGDFVRAGALMGRLEKEPYDDSVKEAKANIEAVKASLINAEEVYQRRALLLPEGAVSQEDHDNALSQRNVLLANLEEAIASLAIAEKNYHDTHLYCPNDGTILTRIREPGTVVEASVPIYTLSLLNPIWVRAFVTETELGEIYFGMPAKVYTDSGRIYDGHIGFISPVAEFTPKTVETTELRTDLVYRLRIIADNPDCYMKQGMPVTVKLDRTSKKGCVHKKYYESHE